VSEKDKGTRAKREPRKPSGVSGLATIRFGGSSQHQFEQLVFPPDKEGIEGMIIAAAMKGDGPLSLRRFYQLTKDPERLPQQDWDFGLETVWGRKYLDLMEGVVLAAGGYEKASPAQPVGAQADAIYARIKAKSDKYGRPRESIHLLLYTTDYRFRLMSSPGDLVAHLLASHQHCFRTVLYCDPQVGGGAMMRVLFPLSRIEIARLESEPFLRGLTGVHIDLREPIVHLPRPAGPSQADR
jgi:hypothetical protein